MAVSAKKYFLSYTTGMYMISLLSSYCSNLAYDYYEEHTLQEDVDIFRMIIFNAAFDVYSFTYLFFRIHLSCSCDEFRQEYIIHVVAFIFLTVYGLLALARGSEFLNLLVCSCAMGICVSFLMLAILHNFNVLLKIGVKTFHRCAALVPSSTRRKKAARKFSPDCII